MTRILAMLIALAMLSACDSGGGSGDNPISRGAEEEDDDDTGGGTGGGTDDEELTPGAVALEDVTRVTVTDDTVIVEGLPLDGGATETAYVRADQFDQNGFLAYVIQDDPLDRYSRAYSASDNNSGSTTATVVATGGQFNKFYRGAYIERTGDYDPPNATATTGLVSYSGGYVGILNAYGITPDQLPVAPGTPIEVIPGGVVLTTTGEVFVNADFADNQVNGTIYDREIAETGQQLPSLVLVPTGIDGNGEFSGSVEYSDLQPDYQVDDIGDAGNGTYEGVFGGPDAEAMAGGVLLDNIDGQEDVLGFEDELEIGAFVLDKCGTAGATDAICDQVNPDFSN